ncbi:hypothetical protein [Streptomyces sp. NPDC026589]|uniref:hypothetical protein n=1 Tax=Streptomyces sp. NPDC026589 TaxID=3155609 RepID=UPI0033F5F507
MFLASDHDQMRSYGRWAAVLGGRARCHVLRPAAEGAAAGAQAAHYTQELTRLPPFRPSAVFAAHDRAAAALALCRSAQALGLDHLVIANAAPPAVSDALRLPVTVLFTDDLPGTGRAHAPAWRHHTTGRTELRLLECRDEDLYGAGSPGVAALQEALRIAPGFGDHIS